MLTMSRVSFDEKSTICMPIIVCYCVCLSSSSVFFPTGDVCESINFPLLSRTPFLSSVCNRFFFFEISKNCFRSRVEKTTAVRKRQQQQHPSQFPVMSVSAMTAPGACCLPTAWLLSVRVCMGDERDRVLRKLPSMRNSGCCCYPGPNLLCIRGRPCAAQK